MFLRKPLLFILCSEFGGMQNLFYWYKYAAASLRKQIFSHVPMSKRTTAFYFNPFFGVQNIFMAAYCSYESLFFFPPSLVRKQCVNCSSSSLFLVGHIVCNWERRPGAPHEERERSRERESFLLLYCICTCLQEHISARGRKKPYIPILFSFLVPKRFHASSQPCSKDEGRPSVVGRRRHKSSLTVGTISWPFSRVRRRRLFCKCKCKWWWWESWSTYRYNLFSLSPHIPSIGCTQKEYDEEYNSSQALTFVIGPPPPLSMSNVYSFTC